MSWFKKISSWVTKRLVEPTTYVGAGLLTQGAMILTKANPTHTEAIGDVFEQVAQPLASGEYNTAIGTI